MSFMHTKKLTKKERDTLWGLVNHPALNDKALAKKTRLKLSTVTAIRRRLRERGYYWEVNIPNFYRLGYEFLSAEYGSFNEAVPFETRTKYFKDYVEEDANIIFSLMSRNNGVAFRVGKNYAEASKQYETMEMYLTSHHLIDEGSWRKVIFPFQTSIFWNFFNFSPLIKHTYDIQKKYNVHEFIPNKEAGTLKLSKKEKKVLYGLVKFPEDSDSSIADRFDISRQAVSSIKKRFIKEDLILTQRIVDFKHTGCGLLSFAYTYFGPKAPLEIRMKGIEQVMKIVPLFVGISSNFENLAFAAMSEYPEYDKIKEKMLSYYKTHKLMTKSPDVLQFPVSDLCFVKNPTFHHLLEGIVDMDE